MARIRKVPERTCVGCRTTRPKHELVRIVRTPDGTVCVDATGKKPGRGAYICNDVTCLEKAAKGNRLSAALETAIPLDLVESLRERLGELR